jgi:ABC-2 type transport system permease protein
MSRIAAVAWRDLKRTANAPVGTFLMLLIPLILSGIIGLAFGSGGDGQTLPKVELLVLDRDDGFLSRFFSTALSQEQASEHLAVEYVGEEGHDLIRQGKASALLILPEGMTDSLLSGGAVEFQLIKNPGQRYLPVVAENGLRLVASALDALVKLLEPELKLIREMPETFATGSAQDHIALISSQMSRRFYQLTEMLTPWPVTLKTTESEKEEQSGLSVFGYVLPGLTVMMLMLIAQKLLREVNEEHETGVLSAVLATPVSITEYATGKALSLLVLILVGFLILLPAGWILFSIHWGNPLSVLILATSFSIATAGLMMILAGVTRTGRQADALGTIVVLVMSLIGGSMIPFRPEQGVLSVVSRLTPNRWAIDGFLATMDGAAPAAVIDEAGVLLVAGLVLLLFGSLLLRRRVMQ